MSIEHSCSWLGSSRVSTVSQDLSEANSLVNLVELLQDIDASAPSAKINEESIDDNNGGRIIL